MPEHIKVQWFVFRCGYCRQESPRVYVEAHRVPPALQEPADHLCIMPRPAAEFLQILQMLHLPTWHSLWVENDLYFWCPDCPGNRAAATICAGTHFPARAREET